LYNVKIIATWLAVVMPVWSGERIAGKTGGLPMLRIFHKIHNSFASLLTFTVTRFVGRIKVLVVGLLKKITKKPRMMLAEIRT
jgi:hypothetical protein